MGQRVLLYLGDTQLEVDAARVRAYEPEEYTPPPPVAAPAPEPPKPTASDLADAAADRYGLPRNLVRSVITAESNWDPKAVSPKGASGLMQIMPATARLLGADPSDLEANIDAGVRYLRDMLLRFHGKLWHALAAYNAGPEAVERYGGVPPYQETVEYIVRVSSLMKQSPE